MEGKEREKLIVDIAVGLTERAKKCSTFSCLRYLKSSSWYTLVRLLSDEWACCLETTSLMYIRMGKMSGNSYILYSILTNDNKVKGKQSIKKDRLTNW